MKQRFDATDTEFESFIETGKYFFFCLVNHVIGICKISGKSLECPRLCKETRYVPVVISFDMICDIETVSALKTLILVFYISLQFFHCVSNCLFVAV